MTKKQISYQNFSRTLEDLIAGKKLARKVWDKGNFITLSVPEEDDKDPKIVDQDDTVWEVPHEDLLAKDWYEIDGEDE